MTQVSYPADGIRTVRPAISIGPSQGKSIFALILDALQHSRSIQAQRVLRQYHDLMFRGDQHAGLTQPKPEERADVDE